MGDILEEAKKINLSLVKLFYKYYKIKIYILNIIYYYKY